MWSFMQFYVILSPNEVFSETKVLASPIPPVRTENVNNL